MLRRGLMLMVMGGLLFAVDAGANPALHKVTGDMEKMTPPSFTPHFQSVLRLEDVSGFQVDRDGNEFEKGLTLQNRFRVGLNYDSGIVWDFFKFTMDYEHEWKGGLVHANPTSLEGDGFPGSEGVEENRLRKAFAKASLGYFLTLGGGITTSQWGLGLLANDGAREWTPGSAYFGASRGGDVVLRGLVATGPYTPEKLTLFFGLDEVQTDDVLVDDDTAKQWVAGLKVGTGEVYSAGVYVVGREQETRDGQLTAVHVVDLYGAHRHKIGDDWTLSLGLETALVTGETDLGATPEFPVHDVLQWGTTGHVGLSGRSWGSVLDVLYASGDSNADDDSVKGFKADINHEMGMMLFRTILAAQSARTIHYASDLDLVGVPAADLERTATRGAVTNTVSIFPRIWVRPLAGLEVYGGPLIALADTPPAEPFNSRIEGGQMRNALGGVPGTFLGVELDLGLRWSGLFWGTLVQFGAEGGWFAPGSALNFSSDLNTQMDNVTAWRLTSAIRF